MSFVEMLLDDNKGSQINPTLYNVGDVYHKTCGYWKTYAINRACIIVDSTSGYRTRKKYVIQIL